MPVVFPDPLVEALDYLRPYAGLALPELPAKYDGSEVAVVVTDTGGAGVYDYVLEDVRLTVDAYSRNQADASLTSREMYALMRDWWTVSDSVYWRGTVSRPQWYPDGNWHRYTFTVALAFRGTETDILPV